MWHVSTLSGPGSVGARLVGGPAGEMAARRVGDRFGPQGARYMITTATGVLCLEDIGAIGAPGNGLEWGIRVNGSQAIYYGNGLTLVEKPKHMI